MDVPICDRGDCEERAIYRVLVLDTDELWRGHQMDLCIDHAHIERYMEEIRAEAEAEEAEVDA